MAIPERLFGDHDVWAAPYDAVLKRHEALNGNRSDLQHELDTSLRHARFKLTVGDSFFDALHAVSKGEPSSDVARDYASAHVLETARGLRVTLNSWGGLNEGHLPSYVESVGHVYLANATRGTANPAELTRVLQLALHVLKTKRNVSPPDRYLVAQRFVDALRAVAQNGGNAATAGEALIKSIRRLPATGTSKVSNPDKVRNAFNRAARRVEPKKE